jgi:hypothetical protein
MKIAVKFDAKDVDEALGELGLAQSPFLTAALVGEIERASCTLLDAPNVPGLQQWTHCFRSLSTALVVLKWTRDDYQLISPASNIAIRVQSGNEDTGLQFGNPKNRTPKGATAVDAIAVNAQLELFAELPRAIKTPDESPEPSKATWFFLFFTDSQKNELRCELSLPVSMDGSGHVTAWRTRIIMGSIPLDPVVSLPEPDFGPDVDVEVKRKA